MKTLLCVLPALLESTDVVVRKIALLTQHSKYRCHLIIHAYNPALRRFFFLSNNNVNAKQLYEDALTEWLEGLISELNHKVCAVDVDVVRSRSCADKVIALSKEESIQWLVLFHKGLSISHDYMDVTHAARCSILLLDTRPWRFPPHICVAIDPFHEDDTSASVDINIIEQGRHLCRLSGSQLRLLYCQFIPPYLLEHKSSITGYLKDALHKFIVDNQLIRDPLSVLNGSPVPTISQYVSRKSVDILVLGLVERGVIERSVTDSTAETLLKRLPCELMLVPVRDN